VWIVIRYKKQIENIGWNKWFHQTSRRLPILQGLYCCVLGYGNLEAVSGYQRVGGTYRISLYAYKCYNRFYNVYIVVLWVTAVSSLSVVSNVSVEPTGSPFMPTSAVTDATVFVYLAMALSSLLVVSNVSVESTRSALCYNALEHNISFHCYENLRLW
jgi:hypothetical protein